MVKAPLTVVQKNNARTSKGHAWTPPQQAPSACSVLLFKVSQQKCRGSPLLLPSREHCSAECNSRSLFLSAGKGLRSPERDRRTAMTHTISRCSTKLMMPYLSVWLELLSYPHFFPWPTRARGADRALYSGVVAALFTRTDSFS